MIEKYENLFTAIGYTFENIKLLEEAFTHNSVGRKHRTYQRLEFLGDRVLGLVIAELLYKNFPNEQEGPLAKRHAELVKEKTLATVAREIDISSYLIISESEKINLDNPSMLSDSCEALIGALYLEAGFETAKQFIVKYWLKKMENQEAPPIDGKSELQEWAQGKSFGLPDYVVVHVGGVEHEPEFTVQVNIKGLKETGSGLGRSKKTAEQDAAHDLLRKIKTND